MADRVEKKAEAKTVKAITVRGITYKGKPYTKGKPLDMEEKDFQDAKRVGKVRAFTAKDEPKDESEKSDNK